MSVTDAPASTEADESAESPPNQVHEIVSLIGPKLHALRTAQRHSLQQLAVLSDVSRPRSTRSSATAWCPRSPRCSSSVPRWGCR
jgi:hypothetical protein